MESSAVRRHWIDMGEPLQAFHTLFFPSTAPVLMGQVSRALSGLLLGEREGSIPPFTLRKQLLCFLGTFLFYCNEFWIGSVLPLSLDGARFGTVRFVGRFIKSIRVFVFHMDIHCPSIANDTHTDHEDDTVPQLGTSGPGTLRCSEHSSAKVLQEANLCWCLVSLENTGFT
ncbi:hypothetical protein DQ04_03691040 [Trypanosoma grayi]|uniref:hypothetical protein n=1 Tax=Trypanosoma grayi TaxID=71804 RepID=UPI0004F4A539|nr:hypothetical protein DQ04_03691040 [Trypanosoma grayi]KEG10459.1 hypothetical protein DQ04_03691040 [Trypanosoma grayi]